MYIALFLPHLNAFHLFFHVSYVPTACHFMHVILCFTYNFSVIALFQISLLQATCVISVWFFLSMHIYFAGYYVILFTRLNFRKWHVSPMWYTYYSCNHVWNFSIRVHVNLVFWFLRIKWRSKIKEKAEAPYSMKHIGRWFRKSYLADMCAVYPVSSAISGADRLGFPSN